VAAEGRRQAGEYESDANWQRLEDLPGERRMTASEMSGFMCETDDGTMPDGRYVYGTSDEVAAAVRAIALKDYCDSRLPKYGD
jgi:hypothetical protein